jgi:hypothetical protein
MGLYRILSSIVTMICSFFAISTLFILFTAFANPAMLFQCFIMASIVLYGWFANRFFAQVIVLKKTMSKKQKDWLQVNAIVTFIASAIWVGGCVLILTSKEALDEVVKMFPAKTKITTSQILQAVDISLVISFLLFVHVVWTYLLIRRNKKYFDS